MTKMLDVMTSMRSHQLMKTIRSWMDWLTIERLGQISIAVCLEKEERIQLRPPPTAIFGQNSNLKVSSKDYFALWICALRHALALKRGSFCPKSPFWIPSDVPLS